MDWVGTHPSFNKWATAKDIGFLHICGSLGSGTTVLASHIIGLIREKHSQKETYFLSFSFNNQDVHASSAETMILSFIRQLLPNRPTLFHHIVCLATWITQNECINKNTLWVLFWSIISHIEDGRLVIIIRALQESSSPVSEIVDNLYSLRALPNLSVKTIITSDHEDKKGHAWEQRLSVQHLHTIRLENDEDARLSVKELVRPRVDRLLLETGAHCGDLGDIITDNFWSSTPSLYWAMAKVDIFEAQLAGMDPTRRAVLEKLEHFPSTIDELFNLMVQRIPLDHMDWIQPGKGLSWIMYALRPLTSSEFAVAVAFDKIEASTSLMSDGFKDTISPNLPAYINRVVGPWVKVEDGRVTIANAALKSLLRAQYPQGDSVIETMFLLKCIRYLAWVRLQVRNGQCGEESCEPQDFMNSTEFDYVPYASVYWPDHFKRAAPVSFDVLKEVLAFLENDVQFWGSLALKYQPNLFGFDTLESPLKIASSLGLTQVVDEILSHMEKPISERNESLIQESVMLAIEHGHSKIALTLYEMQPSCKAPELHKAASGGFNELLRDFLSFDPVKTSIDSYDAFGYTSLHYAAKHGHSDTVNLLLAHGANAKLKSYDGARTTALHLAVRIANLDIIKTLIKSGANATARDSSGYNAVTLSAEGGFDELIRFFMADYVDVWMVQDSVLGGNTPLHLAAMYGHTSMCKFLVHQQADVKAVNANHETPLFLAVKRGFRGIVELLLESERQTQKESKNPQAASSNEKESENKAGKGASANDRSQQNAQSPLQIAAKLGNIDIINLLFKYDYCVTDEDVNKSLRLVAVEGHVKSAKALLSRTTATDPADSEGNTALHLASGHGHADLLHVFLDSGKFCNDLPNERGMTAMHLAAKEGHVRAVAAILKHKGSAEIKNPNGDTPMHLAAAGGHVNVVKRLCAKNPSIRNEKNGDNETPLILAAKRGHAAVVKELLHVPGSESKGSRNNEVWEGFYPLHYAASKGHDELVRLLVTKEKYNVNIRRDPDRQTPIHAAVESKSVTMIPLLIDLGADVIAADENGDTALHFAATMDRLEACKALLSDIPNTKIEAIDLPNIEKETPLHRACSKGYTDVVELLLGNGADCNKRCFDGFTPLHLAAAWRHPNVVRLLLDNKASDYDALDDSEATPIIMAAGHGNTDATAMLLEAGAAVDRADSRGSTALHYAVWGGHLDCVKLLIEKGDADYKRRINDVLTPLHVAAANGHVAVVSYLLEKGAQLSVTAETFGTPLELAMKEGKFDVVEFLVGKGATTTMEISEPSSWGKNAKILEFAQQHPLSFNIAFSTYSLQQAIISADNKLTSDLLEKIADVNEECEPYKTVLQAAAWIGPTSIVERLLQKGADPNIKGGRYGSALHAAIRFKILPSVRLLLEHGADPAIEHEGQGAIFLAFQNGNFEIVTALLERMDSTARAAKDRNGRSLLASAISLGNKTIADYLISLDLVSIKDKDLHGRTLLMEAVLRNNADMVKTLLEMGADPNASDTEGKTPLIRAIASRRINNEIVAALLEHPNLDPALKDCRGRTYVYWAARLGLERNAIESDASEYATDRFDWLLSSSMVLHAAIASGNESIVKDVIGSIQNKDLAELDGDGWTAAYTATRYKMDNMEELKIKLKDLFGPLTVQEPRNWHEEDKSPCLKISDEGKVVTVLSKFLRRIISEVFLCSHVSSVSDMSSHQHISQSQSLPVQSNS